MAAQEALCKLNNASLLYVLKIKDWRLTLDYWKRFLSTKNFLLAWRRINTGLNVSYKRFFREPYLAYEISLDSNLSSLVNRIKGDVYEPQPPDRIFIPKSSGFQRPITLLTIEDQIVWQAIANVLELKWKDRRNDVERKVVFSSHSNPNKIFFFESWKTSYKRFITRIREIYKENRWTAHFDLAAYFDTISHNHISNLMTPIKQDSEIAVFIRKVLSAWSSEKKSGRFSHGIPQGPIASSYVSEVIFLDIDMPMMNAQNGFFYLRYVDDVRLFAKDEDRVREGIIHLEQLCRNKGLVPQAKKSSIFYAETEKDAIGKDISISPEEYTKFAPDEYLHQSVDAQKVVIENVSKLKFYLYRGEAKTEYLDLLLLLFDKNPDFSDAFVHYLGKLKDNQKIIQHLIDMIKGKRFPYQYVEGNVWLLLSIIDTNQKSIALVTIAVERVLKPPTQINPYLRYGLLIYLAPYVKSLSRRVINKYIYEKSSVVQSLLLSTAALFFDSDEYLRILTQCFKRTKPDAGLAASACLALGNIKYESLKVHKQQKSPVRNCLVALGLAKSTVLPDLTPFQEIFKKRYKIDITDWKPIIKGEFKHAHRILVLAERAFEINKSSWICLNDSFNYILIRALIKADSNIKQKLIDAKGNIVNYGVLLNNNDFSTKYTSIKDVFYNVHKRRCSIPEAHPYEEATARRAAFLKTGERNYYYGQLKKAYSELNTAFQNL